GVAAEFFERVLGGDQLDVLDVALLPNALDELPCLLERGRPLQEHRNIERLTPRARRTLRVRDEHVQACRQRKRDADDEHRQKRRELLLRESPERSDERLRMPYEPGGHGESPSSRANSFFGSSRGCAAASSADVVSTSRPDSSRTRRTGKCSSR